MKKIIFILCAVSLLLAACTAGTPLAATTIPTEPTVPSTSAIPTTEVFRETAPTPTPPTEETIAPTTPEPPGDDSFVKVSDYIPDAVIDLRYASASNFTGKRIYEFDSLYLRYGTVKKLITVQEHLRGDGYRLKFWDGFRPPAAQFRLWEICPDATYVSNPNTGFSSHSRGNTVDITLVTTDGNEIPMPTGFDDFSSLADRDYSDCDETAAANAQYLETIMSLYGFRGYYGEWWHYTDTDTYPVEEVFLPRD